MAGDWIKMRTSLLTNPRVNGIAKALESDRAVSKALSTGFNGQMSEIVTRNVMRHITVSSLLVIWGSANEHTKDGVFLNSELSDLDDMAGIPGFGTAMSSVGWAIYNPEENSVTLPNFNEYNTSGHDRSAGAKTAAQRQKEYRDRKKSQQSDVTRDVTNDVTSNRREEKRREDIKEANASLRATKKCPETFVVTDDMQAWAATECPGVDIGIETASLRDHEFKTARKDWPGTWRNWMRKAFKDAQSRPAGRQSFAAQDQQRTEQRASELAPGVARRSPQSTIVEDRNVIALGSR